MKAFAISLICGLLGTGAGACGGDSSDTRQNGAAAPDTVVTTTEQATMQPAPAPADTNDAAPPVRESVDRSADSATTAVPPPAEAGDPIELDPTTEAEIEEVPPQDVVRLLRRTARIYSAMSGMQAEFTMTTRNPLLGTRVTSHGTLYQRRPDRIRLEFTDPSGDLIVGDGEYFWVYYPSVDPVQITKTPAAGTAGVVDLQAQFVGDPITRFDHTAEGVEAIGGREAAIVSLVPRENLGYAKLKIWIDVQDNLVRRFEISDPNGVTRLLDLRNLETGPTLADSLFMFTPPPGTHVVERG
jgi:outer membrane lipoprotein carrier protein